MRYCYHYVVGLALAVGYMKINAWSVLLWCEGYEVTSDTAR